ncbi:lysine methyltransferase 5Ab [Xyrichtys novacula]|uniref:[histone H4]-lysine(20) N-methyltransferase n=1 Tax=Xyrichtys novacula TaxID=13765 RepID=A0AAV1G689_XYRNO|nr:lysine methyltransferase 5Ab [Xyrichtys novacula]
MKASLILSRPSHIGATANQRIGMVFKSITLSLLCSEVEWTDGLCGTNCEVNCEKLDIILGFDMAKGKKTVLRIDIKPEDGVENKVSSRKETKENKPNTNKDCVGTLQSISQSLRTQGKPRSPLSDSSSMLIQDGNESDTTHPGMSKLKKDVPHETNSESCEFKEQNVETALHCHGIREPVTDQSEQKESTVHTNVRPAAVSKVTASKHRSRGRKPGAKKTENKAPQNRKVTDYFPIRRSNRKTEAELKDEEHRHIDDLIKKGIEEGMQVKHIEGKGRGIFATSGFRRGEFVVEYHGDLLELEEAKEREALYTQDPQTGCYMYYFQYQAKTYCVDATKETSRLGRLINHSKNGNCQTKLHPIDGIPHLILVASRDIKAEEELLYDYGDRSKDAISAHPWLKY